MRRLKGFRPMPLFLPLSSLSRAAYLRVRNAVTELLHECRSAIAGALDQGASAGSAKGKEPAENGLHHRALGEEQENERQKRMHEEEEMTLQKNNVRVYIHHGG